MSELLNLLKSNENWIEVIEEKHIEVKYQDNLALFKYKMDADFSDKIVQEARGMIVDLDAMEVVCRPFDKFGNYGESYVPVLDWTAAKVQEKMDGSLIKMWYYDKENRWRVSTNGSIDAFSCYNQEELCFGDMFVEAAMEQNPELFLLNDILNKDYTYMFELISPNNQIVVKYDKTEVYHIGTRNNKTGEEIVTNIGIQHPKEYPLSTLDECIEFAKTFAASEHEGFVVVDKNWNRVKVKSPDYIAAHHLKNNSVLTTKKIVELIYDGEMEEYLTYFPDKKERFLEVKDKIADERLNILNWLEHHSILELDRKEFAILYHDEDYFPFAMQVLYDDKPLEIPKKYWLNFFKAEH